MHRSADFRRHQEQKHKQEVIRHLKEWDNYHQYNNPFWLGRFIRDVTPLWEDKRYVGRMYNTPQTCSSLCCGNVPRKFNGVTRQEYNNFLDALEDEVWYFKKCFKKIPIRYEDPWSWD